ncbi:hypothetical protein [Paenibacillus periandrae]|uniref:hypothetical protein n=1 Tax=Paenibacillus periandrae TaxID=1761741 RepID=UPI001F09564B|nr:hypothetical protein [Paenibacillus periandrae]
MIGKSEEIVDAYEKLAEAGNGVLAIHPHNEEECKERDRLMQEYLRKRTPDKPESIRK